MQRAMAKEAEAERERRAKIVAAEGEFQAAVKLWHDGAERLLEDLFVRVLHYLIPDWAERCDWQHRIDLRFRYEAGTQAATSLGLETRRASGMRTDRDSAQIAGGRANVIPRAEGPSVSPSGA
jgi:regulator of protease activity HflC (stomatin/prohibitin superfamily)